MDMMTVELKDVTNYSHVINVVRKGNKMSIKSMT